MIFSPDSYPEYPHILKNISIPEIPLYEIQQNASHAAPDAVCTFFWPTKHIMTYQDLEVESNQIACWLQSIGVKKGDIVGLYLPNVPQFLPSYYGILKAGAIVSAVNTLFKDLEIKHQLLDGNIKVLITLDIFWPEIQKIVNAVPLKHILVTRLLDVAEGVKFKLASLLKQLPSCKLPRDRRIVTWKTLRSLATASPKWNPVPINPREDVAVLMYTGGTTGEPKGAELTHFNLVANVHQIDAVFKPEDKKKASGIALIPLFHSYGMTGVMNFGIFLQGELILYPKFNNIEEILQGIQQRKATLLPGIAILYNRINMYFDGPHKPYDISSLSICISGAGGLPDQVRADFIKRSGAILCQGYGLSECSPLTHVDPIYFPEAERKVGSIGIPVPQTSFKLVHLEDPSREVGFDEPGELCISGPQVMKGYHNNPRETEDVFLVDADGRKWLRTGDVVQVDRDGFVYHLDRIKLMIKYKGHSVFPKEVENILYQHPAIFECAVMGVPDERGEETILAVISLKPDAQPKPTPEDLTAWAKEHMAPYKYPRIVKLVDDVPKGTAGKILHRVSQKNYLEEMRRGKISN